MAMHLGTPRGNPSDRRSHPRIDCPVGELSLECNPLLGRCSGVDCRSAHQMVFDQNSSHFDSVGATHYPSHRVLCSASAIFNGGALDAIQAPNPFESKIHNGPSLRLVASILPVAPRGKLASGDQPLFSSDRVNGPLAN